MSLRLGFEGLVFINEFSYSWFRKDATYV